MGRLALMAGAKVANKALERADTASIARMMVCLASTHLTQTAKEASGLAWFRWLVQQRRRICLVLNGQELLDSAAGPAVLIDPVQCGRGH